MKPFQYLQILLAVLVLIVIGVLKVSTSPINRPMSSPSENALAVSASNMAKAVNHASVPDKVVKVESVSGKTVEDYFMHRPGADSIHMIRALMSALEQQQASIEQQKVANQSNLKKIESLKALNYNLRQSNRALREEADDMYLELESIKALEENLKDPFIPIVPRNIDE